MAEQNGIVKKGFPRRGAVGEAGAARPSGFVVVALDDELAADTGGDDELAHAVRTAGQPRLAEVLKELGVAKAGRLVRSVPPDRLAALEREAARSEFPPLRSLRAYWRVDLRHLTSEQRARAVKLLDDCPGVARAYEEPLATLPAVTPGDDPYNAGQGYQGPAPDGIGARWMWTQPDGEGAGVAVIDIEGGWRITHEDLTGKAPTLIHGTSNAGWEDHGTAVLGEIVATDNALGVVGTAPAVSRVRMSSIFDATGAQNVTDAFAAATVALDPGDIMLIELQIGFLPMETVDVYLDAIRLAAARGIIVVEAAGNGNKDLDTWTTAGGVARLDRRAAATFVDSGAIMVGASVSTVPHDRWWASNHGSRIDCYAWGEHVTTCGYGDLDDGAGDDDRAYTDTFQGTSSASPMIVSAAALVQSRYRAIAGSSLSPRQMRALLSNPATGTAQGTGVAGAIGVMPDLAAIVPGLGLTPDLYVRDAVGDTGAVPWTGSIASSPDVIVLPAPVADPQLAFGEGSGTEGAVLGGQVEAGQDNYVYVRVRNRGGVAAANVVASVYWSPAATLVTPSLWNLIGTVTLPSVPVGDVLTVSPALTWTRASIPATGHYCFVVLLDHAGDGAPPVPGTLDTTRFYELIRNQNNVTWRNFNVVDLLPDAPSATATFPFLVTGADDRARRFGFAIERRLPRDARLVLEGPLALLAKLRGAHPWKLARGKGKGTGALELPALPRIELGDAVLARRARDACRLVVHAGRQRIAWGHGAAIRQLFEGGEVGRVTWQFGPRPRRAPGEKCD